MDVSKHRIPRGAPVAGPAIAQTIIDSDRRCPRDSKLMAVEVGQDDTTGWTRKVHVCLNCDYTEADEAWPRPKLTKARTMADKLNAMRLGDLGEAVSVWDYVYPGEVPGTPKTPAREVARTGHGAPSLEPAPTVTAVALAERTAPQMALSFTADPCTTCGWLPDLDGNCATCDATPEAEAPAIVNAPPMPEVPPVAPFAVKAKVRYEGKSHTTTYEVTEIWPIGGGAWVCHVRDSIGRMMRGIPAAWLEVVPDAAPALFAVKAPAPVEVPAPVVPIVATHCRRCGSTKCQCGPKELARYLALTAATTADEVYAATAKYTAAVAGRGV
jgi:hypothetical protein